MSSTVDPILTSVLQRRVQAISQEMATVLMRSSRSPIFNEVGDLVTVIFDAEAKTLAQTEYAAIIAFGARPPLERIIEYFGDDLAEGDVIAHNDVYTGGNQCADVGIYLPVFYEGELVAWTASKGHVADIGGMTMGGYNPEATEIWQEALRITPVKLYEAGELRRDVWDLINANIRLDLVGEDIKSMIGACTIGKRRLIEVLDRYGTDAFRLHMERMLEASEAQLRAEIERWPDGVYEGESWMVSDGLDPEARYKIHCRIEVAGSDITFDFSESDDQAPGITNMPPASAMGAVSIALLMLVNAGGVDIPTNHGLLSPMRFVFREGSLLNPRFPAATVFGNQMCDEVLEAIMVALAPALPDRVTAGWNQLLCTVLSGVDPRTGAPFVELTTFQRGGSGAMKGTDGYDALGFTGTPGSMRSPDMEIFELGSPHQVEHYELLPGSAGAGRWRGGYGTRAAWRFNGEHELGVTIGDDAASEDAEPAVGLFGGAQGTLNELDLHYPDGSVKSWGSKEIVREIPPGTRCVSLNGGGAGYGDPFERDPESVRIEVRDGMLTPDSARERYGVVVDEAGSRVDEDGTARARAKSGLEPQQ